MDKQTEAHYELMKDLFLRFVREVNDALADPDTQINLNPYYEQNPPVSDEHRSGFFHATGGRGGDNELWVLLNPNRDCIKPVILQVEKKEARAAQP